MPSLPGYEVSNLGRVRRSTPGKRTVPGRILKAQLQKVGYYSVRPTIGGENVHFYVHDLVAAAFIGAKPDGWHVNHLDGVKTNNHAWNLEYVTRKGNMEHAARTGLMARGDRLPQAKLTPDSVIALRSDRAAGVSFSKLAAKYGVSIATAFNAANGKNWSHVA